MRKNNKLLTALMILCTMLSVAILSIISYDKFFRKVDEKKAIETKPVASNSCIQGSNKNSQMLNTKMGMVFLTSDGDVYFEPTKEKGANLKTSPLEVAKKSLGKQEKYTLSSSKEFKDENYTFEGYKLDLCNIKAMYEFDFDNNKFNDTILLVSNNGRLSEFAMTYDSNGNLVIELTKDIANYTDVVSVVKYDYLDGTGAYIIDRCGKKIEYTK